MSKYSSYLGKAATLSGDKQNNAPKNKTRKSNRFKDKTIEELLYEIHMPKKQLLLSEMYLKKAVCQNASRRIN